MAYIGSVEVTTRYKWAKDDNLDTVKQVQQRTFDTSSRNNGGSMETPRALRRSPARRLDIQARAKRRRLVFDETNNQVGLGLIYWERSEKAHRVPLYTPFNLRSFHGEGRGAGNLQVG